MAKHCHYVVSEVEEIQFVNFDLVPARLVKHCLLLNYVRKHKNKDSSIHTIKLKESQMISGHLIPHSSTQHTIKLSL